MRKDLSVFVMASLLSLSMVSCGGQLSPTTGSLGTLYSIGLEGRRGVHPNPQANARGRAIARYAARLEERAASRYAAAPV